MDKESVEEYIKKLQELEENFSADNIDDFDKKFVIYKTINQGYHVIYRCKEITGNKKIAKLKDKKEAIIESRGIGGYVVIYENQKSLLSYSEIQEIDAREREILWDLCKAFNYEEKPIKVEQTVQNEYQEQNNDSDLNPERNSDITS